jgi:hypothetical protein
MVDLVGLGKVDRASQRSFVADVALEEYDPAIGAITGVATHQAVDTGAFGQKLFAQVGPVLAGSARHEHAVASAAVAHRSRPSEGPSHVAGVPGLEETFAMRDLRSIRGFGAGLVVGVLVGSAGLSVAAISYKGWHKFSPDFRTGYVAGFVDMSNLARNLDPGGYIDANYPYIVGARPIEWSDMIAELYKDPQNQGYTITSLMMLAAHKLQEKHGVAGTPTDRVNRKMEMQLDAVRRMREKMGIKPDQGRTKTAEAPPRVVEPETAVKAPTQRKWCRCDGKDPKAAQVQRKAAAAEQEKREDAESEKPSGDGGAKTPPSAKTP